MNTNHCSKMNEVNVKKRQENILKNGRTETVVEKNKPNNVSAVGKTGSASGSANANVLDSKRVMRKIVIDPNKLKNLGLNRKIAKALGDGINTNTTPTAIANTISTSTPIASSDAVSVNSNLEELTTAATTLAKSKVQNEKVLNHKDATSVEDRTKPTQAKISNVQKIITTKAKVNTDFKGVPGLFAKYRPQLDYNLMTPNMRLLHAKNILQGHLLKKETNNNNDTTNNNKINKQKNNSNTNNKNYKTNNKSDKKNNNKNQESKVLNLKSNDNASTSTDEMNNVNKNQLSISTTSIAAADKDPTTDTPTSYHNYLENSNMSSRSSIGVSSSSSSSNSFDFNSFNSSDSNIAVEPNDGENINNNIKSTKCEVLVPTTEKSARSSPQIENLNPMKSTDFWNDEQQFLNITIPQEQKHTTICQKEDEQQQIDDNNLKSKCYIVAAQISPLKLTLQKTSVLPTISTFENLTQNNRLNDNNNIDYENANNICSNTNNNSKSSLKQRKIKSKESKAIVLEHKILSTSEKFDISSLNSTATAAPTTTTLNNDVLLLTNSNKLNLESQFDNLTLSLDNMPIDIIPDNVLDVDEQPSHQVNKEQPQKNLPIEIFEQNSSQNISLQELPTSTQIDKDSSINDNESMNAVDFLASLSETSQYVGYELTEREKRRQLRRNKKPTKERLFTKSPEPASDMKMQEPQLTENFHDMVIDNPPIELEPKPENDKLFETVQELQDLAINESLDLEELQTIFVEKCTESQSDDINIEFFKGFEDDHEPITDSTKEVATMIVDILDKRNLENDLNKMKSFECVDISLNSVDEISKIKGPEYIVKNEVDEQIPAKTLAVEKPNPRENYIETIIGRKTTSKTAKSLELIGGNDGIIGKQIEIKTQEALEFQDNGTMKYFLANCESLNILTEGENHDITEEKMQREIEIEKCEKINEIIENSAVTENRMNSEDSSQQQLEQEISNSNSIPLKKRWELAAQKSNFDDDDTTDFHITDDASPMEDDEDIDYAEKSRLGNQPKNKDKEEEKVAKAHDFDQLKGEIEKDPRLPEENILIKNKDNAKTKKVEIVAPSPRKKRRASEIFLANLKSAKQTKQNRINMLKEKKEKKEQQSKKINSKPSLETNLEPAPKPELVIMTTIVKKSDRIKSRTNKNTDKTDVNINTNNESPLAEKEALRDDKKIIVLGKSNLATPAIFKETEIQKRMNEMCKDITVEKRMNEKNEPIKIVQKNIVKRTTLNKNNDNNSVKNINKNEDIKIEIEDDNENKKTVTNLSSPKSKRLCLESTENPKTNEFNEINEYITASHTSNKNKRKSQNKTIADYFNKTPSKTSTSPTITKPVTTTEITSTTTRKSRKSQSINISDEVAESNNNESPTVPPKKRARISKTPSAVPADFSAVEVLTTPVLPGNDEPNTDNTSSGPKKRGRKPKSLLLDTPVAVAKKDSPKVVNSFNPRLLLIRDRKQLDTDEILTNNKIDNSANKQTNSIQCGLCFEFTSLNNWKIHKSEHYGIGWKAGSQPPIDTTNRSNVLSEIIKYFKETKIQQIECRMCQRSYRSGLGMLTHLESCGIQTERVPCPHCQKLLSKVSLSVHVRGCHYASNRSDKEQASSADESLNASDLSKTSHQLSITGRIKRASRIKAEKKLKKIDAIADERRRLVKHVPALLEVDLLEKWREQISTLGNAHCVHDEKCAFIAEDCNIMLEHYKNCEYARKVGFYCQKCANDGDKDTVPFESEKEAMLHVKSQHSRTRTGDSESEFEHKSSSSSSDDEDEDIGSDVNEEDEDIDDSNNTSLANKKKQSSSIRKGNEAWYAKPHMFPMRSADPTAVAQNRWQEFLTLNYSTSSLFNFAQASYKLNTKLQLDQLLPDHMTSMKFAFSEKCEPVNKLGVQPVPENCQQLKRFEFTTNDCEFLMYLGASVKHMEWVPVPLNTNAQYLCISYRMHDKFTPLQAPEKRSDCIILYKVTTKEDSKAPLLEKQYAVHIDNGPVHTFTFLPSGGYDEENNRLGLMAVGTVEQGIRIYALPLKIEEEQPSDDQLLFIDVPVVMVLTSIESAVSSKKKQLVTKRAQCLNICWSESKGHNIIAAGFTNGYIGLWDIEEVKLNADNETSHTDKEDSKNEQNNDDDDDFDKININIYYKNDIRHIKPINYFYSGEKIIRCLALHYDYTNGERWLAVTTWSRKFIIYDLINLQRPLLMKNLSMSSIIMDMNWSPIWESLSLAFYDPVPHQKNGDIFAAFSPTSLSFTRSKVDGMICGLTQAQYNPLCNLHACSCDNGDIVLIETREMYLEDIYHRKKNKEPRAISTMDLIQLNGQPLPYPTVDNTQENEPGQQSLLDEENYMDKYALIFKPMIKYETKFQKNYFSHDRRPHFFAEHMLRINALRFNRNPCASHHYLLAVGYENGFVRLLRFKKEKYF